MRLYSPKSKVFLSDFAPLSLKITAESHCKDPANDFSLIIIYAYVVFCINVFSLDFWVASPEDKEFGFQV